MPEDQDFVERIHSGDCAYIENVQEAPLAVSVLMTDGSRIDMALAPGAGFEIKAGDCEAQVILHDGTPEGLSVIKPDAPS